MDDWQEAALSNRHLHNRRGQNTRGKSGKGATFDVKRAFGTYVVKCPAAEKLLKDSGNYARLEIYCLNDVQNALYAELDFPGLFHAVAILAGSRRVMNTVIRELRETMAKDESTDPSELEAPHGHADDEDADEYQDEDGAEDEDFGARRAKEFEKNSFRSPKFWLKYQGELSSAQTELPSSKIITDSGYLVFSGNSCDKFEGTISCEALEWDNVKLKGWKESSRSARNFDLAWHDTQVSSTES